MEVGVPLKVEVNPVESLHRVWVSRKDTGVELEKLIKKLVVLDQKGLLPVMKSPAIGSMCIARYLLFTSFP